MTAANFDAYKINSIGGGATTSGSTAVTVSSTTICFRGNDHRHRHSRGTIITKVVDSATVTISAEATASNSGLTFAINADKVPTTYTTYPQGLADFNLASLDTIAGAMDQLEVPMRNRFALLSGPTIAAPLRSRPQHVLRRAADAQHHHRGQAPAAHRFAPYNAPYFPSSNNRVGFLGHRASIILKTRLPGDLGSSLPGVPIPARSRRSNCRGWASLARWCNT